MPEITTPPWDVPSLRFSWTWPLGGKIKIQANYLIPLDVFTAITVNLGLGSQSLRLLRSVFVGDIVQIVPDWRIIHVREFCSQYGRYFTPRKIVAMLALVAESAAAPPNNEVALHDWTARLGGVDPIAATQTADGDF